MLKGMKLDRFGLTWSHAPAVVVAPTRLVSQRVYLTGARGAGCLKGAELHSRLGVVLPPQGRVDAREGFGAQTFKGLTAARMMRKPSALALGGAPNRDFRPWGVTGSPS